MQHAQHVHHPVKPALQSQIVKHVSLDTIIMLLILIAVHVLLTVMLVLVQMIANLV